MSDDEILHKLKHWYPEGRGGVQIALCRWYRGEDVVREDGITNWWDFVTCADCLDRMPMATFYKRVKGKRARR